MNLPDPPLHGHSESERVPSPPKQEQPPEPRRSWDEVVEESFPASDPPPTPIRIGSSEREEEEEKKEKE